MNTLFEFIKNGDTAAVERLLTANPALRDISREHGWTPLHRSVDHGCRDIVALLIAQGANVNARDDKGRTPLFSAMSHINIAMLLIQGGADVNAQDYHGRTPLYCYAFYGYADAMRLLINHGADIYARDQENSTPLHQAAISGVKEAVALLLSCGAQVDAKDNFGSTPLHEAVGANMMQYEVQQYLEVITELVGRGADIMAQTHDGKTALDLARGQAWPAILEFLTRHAG